MRAGEVGGRQDAVGQLLREGAGHARAPSKAHHNRPPKHPAALTLWARSPAHQQGPPLQKSEAKGGSVSRCKQQVAAGTRAVWQPTDAKRLQTQPQPASLQLHGPNHHPRSTHCPRRRAGGRLQDEGAGRQGGESALWLGGAYSCRGCGPAWQGGSRTAAPAQRSNRKAPERPATH